MFMSTPFSSLQSESESFKYENRVFNLFDDESYFSTPQLILFRKEKEWHLIGVAIPIRFEV